MQDFPDQGAALKTADDIVEQSSQMFGFKKETVEHENPLLVKCLYMHTEGKRHEVVNVETKKIEGSADINKSSKALVDAKEVTGGTSIFDKDEPGGIKLEFPHFSEAKVEAEKNKSFEY